MNDNSAINDRSRKHLLRNEHAAEYIADLAVYTHLRYSSSYNAFGELFILSKNKCCGKCHYNSISFVMAAIDIKLQIPIS